MMRSFCSSLRLSERQEKTVVDQCTAIAEEGDLADLEYLGPTADFQGQAGVLLDQQDSGARPPSHGEHVGHRANGIRLVTSGLLTSAKMDTIAT